MPDIFRAGIAEKINNALGPLVFDATLIVITPGTRTAGQETSGTNPTSTSHAAKGFVDDYESRFMDGKLIQVGDKKVTLLGESMNAVPKAGDKVTIEGETRQILSVVRDPAGATYECHAR